MNREKDVIKLKKNERKNQVHSIRIISFFFVHVDAHRPFVCREKCMCVMLEQTAKHILVTLLDTMCRYAYIIAFTDMVIRDNSTEHSQMNGKKRRGICYPNRTVKCNETMNKKKKVEKR